MWKEILIPVLTRALVAVLAGAGISGGETEAQVAGAVALGGAVVWSVIEKVRARRALKKESRA